MVRVRGAAQAGALGGCPLVCASCIRHTTACGDQRVPRPLMPMTWPSSNSRRTAISGGRSLGPTAAAANCAAHSAGSSPIAMSARWSGRSPRLAASAQRRGSQPGMAGRRVGALTACGSVGTRARSGSCGSKSCLRSTSVSRAAVHQTVGCDRRAMRGPDPAAPGRRRRAAWSRMSCGNSRFAGRNGGHIAADLSSAASATARRPDRSSPATLAGARSSISCPDRWAAAYTPSIRTMVIRSPSTSYSTR